MGNELATVAEGRLALVPKSYQEAMNIARLFSTSELVPKSYRGKQDAIVVAICAGAPFGLSAWQSMRSICVINGLPTMYGDALCAIVRASGVLDPAFGCGGIKELAPDEALSAGYGECSIMRKGWTAALTRRFSLDEAKVAGLIERGGPDAPWTKYRGRMLMFKARNWAFRDGLPDICMDIGVREIVEAEPMREAEGVAVRDPQRKDTVPTQAEVDAFLAEAQAAQRAPGAPQAAHAGSPAASAAPSPEPRVWSGKIKSVTSKEGTTNGKAWVNYAVTGADDSRFGSMDRGHADLARQIRDAGEEAQITWAPDASGKYKNLTGILSLGKPEVEA